MLSEIHPNNGRAASNLLRLYRIVCSKMHSQEARNYDYYDHDTDDVENVHCVLLSSM
jgi:hypothetical protein